MLDSTIVMLAASGYRGASFSSVLERARAPRGSIYHHFPGGKDELIAEAIRLSWTRTDAFLDSLSGRSARDVVAEFVGLWRTLLERTDFGIGCSVLGVSVSSADAGVRTAAGEIFGAWRARLAVLLAAGGVVPERSDAVAALVLSACEGAVAISRAERSTEPLDLVETELVAVVA
jgi:AcrR family transcriptional regulator